MQRWLCTYCYVFVLIRGQLKVIEVFSYRQSMPFTRYSFTGEVTVADEILSHSSVVGLSLTTTGSWIKN